MVLLVQADLLGLLVDAEVAEPHQEEEGDAGECAGPHDHSQDEDDLGANGPAPDARLAVAVVVGHAGEAAPAVVVVHPPAPVEEAAGQHAPDAAGAVHRARVDGVVDLQPLLQHRAALVDDASDHADEEGRACLDVAAPGGDRHESREDAVAEAADVVELRDEVAEDKDREAAGGCRDRGVHGHLGAEGARLRGAHAQGGAAVEAVPGRRLQSRVLRTWGDFLSLCISCLWCQ